MFTRRLLHLLALGCTLSIWLEVSSRKRLSKRFAFLKSSYAAVAKQVSCEVIIGLNIRIDLQLRGTNRREVSCAFYVSHAEFSESYNVLRLSH